MDITPAIDDELRRLSSLRISAPVKERMLGNMYSKADKARDQSGLLKFISRLSPEKRQAVIERNADATTGLLDYAQFYSDDDDYLLPVTKKGLEDLPYKGMAVPFGFANEPMLSSSAHALYSPDYNTAYIPGKNADPSYLLQHEGLHSLFQNMGWLDMKLPTNKEDFKKMDDEHHKDVVAVDLYNQLQKMDTLKGKERQRNIPKLRGLRRKLYGLLDPKNELGFAEGEKLLDSEMLNRVEQFQPGGIFANY